MPINPQPADLLFGHRMRMRRAALGMSQDTLGKAIGVTFQQVQKYEKGINRVGASRIVAIAAALNIQVSYFFERIESKDEIQPDRRTLEFAKLFQIVPERYYRTSVFQLMQLALRFYANPKNYQPRNVANASPVDVDAHGHRARMALARLGAA